MTTVRSLHAQIIEMNKRVSRWMERVDCEFQRIWNINQIEPGKFQEKLQETTRIAESAAGEDPREEVFALITLASWLYLQVDDRERSEIRTMFADNQSVLQQMYNYIGSQTSALSVDGNEECMLLALLAASIENQQTDTRDLHLRLIDLRKAAHKHNIDADTYFSKVARLSSDKPPRKGIKISTQEFLRSFLAPN